MSGKSFEVPDPMVPFIDDDPGYLTWYRQNFHGYVLNAEKKPSDKYLMLHRVPCVHLEGDLRWTTTDQCKVCSPTKEDVDNWTMQEFGRQPDRCSSCQP